MSLITEGADRARAAGADARVEPSLAGVGDYVALMKPRVMSLVVFTALVGLVVAPGHLNPVVGFVALLCIAIGAGAAGALNMWYDADIDAVMTPTAHGRVPAGDRMGGDGRRHRRRGAHHVPHHLFLDAAAFLGAVAVARGRLCPRRHPDAAGGRRAARDSAADPDLFARACPARRAAVA